MISPSKTLHCSAISNVSSQHPASAAGAVLTNSEPNNVVIDDSTCVGAEKSDSFVLSSRFRWRLLLGSIVLASIGITFLPFDRQIANRHVGFKIPGDLRKAVELSEFFAHAIGAAVVLGSLWYLDVRRRAQLLNAAIMTAGAGILVNLIKLPINRIRPYALDEWLANPANLRPVWDSWLPILSQPISESPWHSFPSGHSAVATALAIGLTTVYPRGWWIFSLLAIIACYQRFFVSAHYLGDIFCGSAVAMIWCFLCLSSPKGARQLFT